MKAKTFILILAVLCFVGVIVSYGADDAFMGTWKLNEAKSKFAPGATKLTTVVYEAAGDNVKITADSTDSNGAAIHHEWTGKSTARTTPSLVIRHQTCGPTRKSTITRWRSR